MLPPKISSWSLPSHSNGSCVISRVDLCPTGAGESTTQPPRPCVSGLFASAVECSDRVAKHSRPSYSEGVVVKAESHSARTLRVHPPRASLRTMRFIRLRHPGTTTPSGYDYALRVRLHPPGTTTPSRYDYTSSGRCSANHEPYGARSHASHRPSLLQRHTAAMLAEGLSRDLRSQVADSECSSRDLAPLTAVLDGVLTKRSRQATGLKGSVLEA